MQLILVRHGVAEDRRLFQDDRARELTQEGREKLRPTLDAIRDHLPAGASIHLVSSPALRARQTAELIAQSIGHEGIQQLPWIYAGGADELALLLSDVQKDEDGGEGGVHVLILAGHQPHLSIWSAELLNRPLMFKKGGAAAFQLDGRKSRPARLLWSLRTQP